MSRCDDTVRLRHMLDYAREAIALLRGRTRLDLDQDRLRLRRLVRAERLATVGQLAAGAARARSWSCAPCTSRAGAGMGPSWL